MSNSSVEVLAKLSVGDQVRAYAESIAVVQAHGGGSATAIFLPQGATFVVVADTQSKSDYVQWAHMGHIKPRWFELGSNGDALDTKEILLLLSQAVYHYHDYNACYDSGDFKAPPHIAKALAAAGVQSSEV